MMISFICLLKTYGSPGLINIFPARRFNKGDHLHLLELFQQFIFMDELEHFDHLSNELEVE